MSGECNLLANEIMVYAAISATTAASRPERRLTPDCSCSASECDRSQITMTNEIALRLSALSGEKEPPTLRTASAAADPPSNSLKKNWTREAGEESFTILRLRRSDSTS